MPPNSLLQGELVRLVAIDPETDGDTWARWTQDSEYGRLLDSDPALPRSALHFRGDLEKIEQRSDTYIFAVRTLAGNRLIGFVDLGGIQWSHRNCSLGIGIGEREFWGMGYGSDTLRVVLRYAFTELNLERVSLDVFEYNQRAIHCYEKLGFVHEGCMRGALNRDGRRWDMLYMGILREEWQKQEVA
jgi:RimJ/RimL family protein N-acetyltransferase